jgi:2-hydroxy-4-(methylsulfanyl)butanoate S-methyltransferase
MAETSQAKPIEDVRQISAITYGFMASKALFAALDFDLFTHIERGANSAVELAKATGVSENLLLTMLTALKSLGLIVERDGRFANAPATAKFLVAGAPGDFRDYVRLVNGAFGYESFRHLTAALRGERIFPGKGFYEGMIYSAGLGGEAFSAAQHSGSLGPARLTAKRMSLAGRKRLLDVGGGSGAYTLAFCAANPQLKATILDFPQTVETAKRYALDAGLAGRVAHLAGNAMTTQWPAGHDVVLMSYVWSAVGGADIEVLARRLRRAPFRRPRSCTRLHGGQRLRAPAIRRLVPAGQHLRQSERCVPDASLRGAGPSAGGLPDRRNRGDVAGDHHANESAQARMSTSVRTLCCPAHRL